MKRPSSYTVARLLLLPLLAIGLSACGDAATGAAAMAQKKIFVENCKTLDKDTTLAIVWKKEKGGFVAGAMLAMDEINAAGGILQRPLHLAFTDETPFLQDKKLRGTEGRYRNVYAEAGTNIAKNVMSNPDVTAVIGHRNPDVILTAMMAYQDRGILLLAGNAVESRIKWSSKDLYFQLRPKVENLAVYMTKAIAKHHWRNVYIVYQQTPHNEQVAALLATAFSRNGSSEGSDHIRLVGSSAVTKYGDTDPTGSSMIRLRRELSELDPGSVDGIVLLTPLKLGAEVAKISRSLGINQPFFGGSELEDLIFVAGMEVIGMPDSIIDTLFTTLYRKDDYQIASFKERFEKHFKEPINESAAMGYDSVRLYAQVVTSSCTTNPAVLANGLQYNLPLWYGLLGTYIFKDRNNIGLKYYTNRLIGVKSIDGITSSDDAFDKPD